MIALRELLKLWGFKTHPFETYTAENEPRLSEYFVAPPYLDDMIGTATAMTPSIVFGARGVGKSAIRIHIENMCLSKDSFELLGGNSLAITYDTFPRPSQDLGVSLDDHLRYILAKMVAASLTVMTEATTGLGVNRDSIETTYPNLDLQVLGSLVKRHFQNLNEHQKEAAFRGTYNYVSRAGEGLSDRGRFFQAAWGAIRAPLIDIANIVQAVRGKDMITPVQIHETKERAEPMSTDALVGDLIAMSTVISQLKFDGWYILVDKVDEDDTTEGDANKSAKLIAPLLKNLKILEIERIGFKFFLWNQLRDVLNEERVRFDKMRNWEMHWTNEELREMINRRLSAYSEGRVEGLNYIFKTEVTDPYDRIFYYAMSSPREIAHILDSVFRTHARHTNANEDYLIGHDSLERGLDDYVTRRVKDLYPPALARTLAGLPGNVFSSADVQKSLRISRQASSIRINKWIDDGYIERTEDGRSEADPSKSIHQYKFKEKRLERIIERNLLSS